MPQHVRRIAHRGASAYEPEHTRSAFRRAIEIGVDMIELDVHLSADRELVVIHDATLERTTNGRGAVRDHSMAELKKLDSSSWFGAVGGSSILTLAEVIDLLPDAVHLNVEIKSPEEDWAGTAQALASLLEARQRLSSTIVSSFLFGALTAARRASAAIAIGVLWHLTDLEPAFDLAKDIDAVALHPYWPLVDAPLIQRAHDADLRVLAWTVNDPADMHKLIELGVDGIISDYPDRLRSVVA